MLDYVYLRLALKLTNHDISNAGNPTLFHWAKSIEKNIEER